MEEKSSNCFRFSLDKKNTFQLAKTIGLGNYVLYKLLGKLSKVYLTRTNDVNLSQIVKVYQRDKIFNNKKK